MADSRSIQAILVAAMAAVLLASASAQSSSCSSAIMSLSPCLDYITGNASTPSSSCCSQLSSVVQSEPQCICTLISSGASSASSLGITVNQTQALALPGACKVQVPLSQCNGKHRALLLLGSCNPSSKWTECIPSDTVHITFRYESDLCHASPVQASVKGCQFQSALCAGVGSKSNPVTSTDSSDGASAGVPLALLLSLVAIATYPFTSLVIV
ncbi:hypothetical protein GW17_00048453 [Ensete ventricosum]|nr:hypothetical protein GW17_00048453 [Ensete ventricosum]